MNDPKHRLTEKDTMTIELSGQAEAKFIKKGEHTSIPLGSISWAGGKATTNGLLITWGHRGETGVFVPEGVLKQALQSFGYYVDPSSTPKIERDKDNGTDNDNS